MHWLLDFFQGGLDNVTKKEAERDFEELLKILRAAPDYEIGVLLCCLTCPRLGFEGHGDFPRELFKSGDNASKGRAKVIQSNLSVTVHGNFARTGDRVARLAGLILLCSIRAVAYPEFNSQAGELWNLVGRGRSKEGMVSFLDCLKRRGVPYTEIIPEVIIESRYVPPIFTKDSSAPILSSFETAAAHAPAVSPNEPITDDAPKSRYFDYGFAEKWLVLRHICNLGRGEISVYLNYNRDEALGDAARFLDDGGELEELVDGMRLGYIPIADVVGTKMGYFAAIVEYAKRTSDEPEKRFTPIP